MKPANYYELLQINPNAEPDTIHRVFRFLAARFHPDNPESGEPDPLSNQVDFLDSIDGELNRRLALLALLYYRRRTSPTLPAVALNEVEEKMGFPRDYLEFTTWYLTRKGYITRADNSAFTLTAEGVDFVETQRGNIPVLNKLLTSSTGPFVTHAAGGPVMVPPSHSAVNGNGAATTVHEVHEVQ